VSCRVAKQFGADTVQVADAVKAAIGDLSATLPPGVRLRVVYDQSELIRSALGGVSRAVLLGGLLVVLTLFALLGDVRSAVIVTVTIPVSMLLAGLVLPRIGVGLNTMTLGGLAIAVGLLVDASIIMTENILHRLNQGRDADAPTVAQRAASEVGRPIAFAVLIVVAVFTPLFAMSGIEGRMYRPLAAAVVATLGASLVLALTIVPVVAARLLRPHRGSAQEEDTWLIRGVKRAYRPLLDWSLRHAPTVRVLSVLVTAPLVALAFFVGSDFIPPLDEGAFLLQTNLPPEASLAEVDRPNHRVEDILRQFPEVEDVSRRTGRAERTEDPMPHTLSDVLVLLKPDRARTGEELEEAMREAVEQAPGVSTLFTTPLGMRIDEGLGGTPADLSVRIFGPDLEQLVAMASQVQAIVSRIDGLTDVRAEALTGLPQLRIAVDREAAVRAGLAAGDVIRAVEVGMAGLEHEPVWVGQRRYDLVVRLQDAKRDDIAAIGNLLIDTHTGVRVPLSKVATLERTNGPAAIRREAGSRRIAVEASVSGRDLASAAEEVRRGLARGLKLPAGYFVRWVVASSSRLAHHGR